MYSKYPKHEVLPVLLSAAVASPAQKSPQDQGHAEKAPAAVPAKTFLPLQSFKMKYPECFVHALPYFFLRQTVVFKSKCHLV